MSKSPPIFRSESRVLGLDTCNPRIVIGAILRGELYLDGVLTFSAEMKTSQLASKINTTKYRPELRAVMIHDPSKVLSSSIVERITGLPILDAIAIKNGPTTSRMKPSQTRLQKINGAIPMKSTIDQILASTEIKGRLAEPVRIAHLLAKLHVFGRFLQEKR